MFLNGPTVPVPLIIKNKLKRGDVVGNGSKFTSDLTPEMDCNMAIMDLLPVTAVVFLMVLGKLLASLNIFLDVSLSRNGNIYRTFNQRKSLFKISSLRKRLLKSIRQKSSFPMSSYFELHHCYSKCAIC
jgi:hypothetical protein